MDPFLNRTEVRDILHHRRVQVPKPQLHGYGLLSYSHLKAISAKSIPHPYLAFSGPQLPP